MKTLRTTFRTNEKELTLGYSNQDLSVMMRTHFSQHIGVFDNHTVANGMDTDAWVTRGRQQVLNVVETFMATGGDIGTLQDYMQQLSQFLSTVEDERIEIRHHYAWWYPKWLDMLRATW